MKHREYKQSALQLCDVAKQRRNAQASRFANRRERRMEERRNELLGQVSSGNRTITQIINSLSSSVHHEYLDNEIVQDLKDLLSLLNTTRVMGDIVRETTRILIHLIIAAKKITVQTLSAWCLVNITYSGHDSCQIVIEYIPQILKMLSSPFLPLELQEPCLWVIGNILGCCKSCKDQMISQQSIVSILVQILQTNHTQSLKLSSMPIGCQSIAAWGLGNLLRGCANENIIAEMFACGVQSGLLSLMKRAPRLTIEDDDMADVNDVDVSLLDSPTLGDKLLEETYSGAGDAAILAFHLCSSIESISSLMSMESKQLNNNISLSLSDLSKEAITIISCCCAIMLEGSHADGPLAVPALRLLGCLASTSPSLASLFARQSTLLRSLYSLLHVDNTVTIKESLFLLSNLSCTNSRMLRQKISHLFLSSLLELFKNSDFSIKKEICFILTNLVTVHESNSARNEFFSPICILQFLELLAVDDNTCRSAVLYFIQYYLRHSDDAQQFLSANNGFSIIESLYYKDKGNSKIYEEILNFQPEIKQI